MFKSWWQIPEMLEAGRKYLQTVFDYCYEEGIPQEQIQIIDTEDRYLPVEEHLNDLFVSIVEYEPYDGHGYTRFVFRVIQ